MKRTGLKDLWTALSKVRLKIGAAIVEVRVAASILVLLLAHGTEAVRFPPWVDSVLLGYIGINLILASILRKRLHQKRIRILPEVVDLIAISLLVSATGGLKSAWFVLYLFPVMSAARFMGSLGIISLATFAGLGYALATSISSLAAEEASLLSFILRVLALGGASLTAANLARTRDKGEAELVDAIEKVDRLILADGDNDRVLGLILETALKLTQSDVCAMILLEGNRVTATFTEAAASINGEPRLLEGEKVGAGRLLQDCFRRHIESGQPLALPQRGFLSILGDSLRKRSHREPLSGRLVPLVIDGEPIGVLGVFTLRRFHYYTRNDLRKLASLAPLVAMAQKNAKLFRESAGRLELLYRIGGQLKAEYGLDELFKSVVDLVSEQLGSEEAALFIPDDKGERLEKKAVSGPDPEITQGLLPIERLYEPGDLSLTRKVFDDKQFDLVNTIDLTEVFVDEYSQVLPSQVTLHYLGVPLVIGDEVLGVIRVLNKKAVDYEPRAGCALLAPGGFRKDDLQLLTFAATQIAAAIRNAKFVEQKRYLENLVYTSPDPTIVVDDKGHVRNFNRACEEIWLRREHEVLGHSVSQFYPSLEHAREIGRRLWEEPTHVLRDFPTEIRAADMDIPIRLSAALLLDDKDRVVGSIGIFRDQRPLLLLQEENLRNEKLAALGRLAQTASHDIKHDFGTILTFLRPIERRVREDPDLWNAVRSVRTAALEALSKIQTMLLAARPKQPDREIISLRSELEAFHQNVQQRAAAMRVDLTLQAPTQDVPVFADVELLRQVLSNLFNNSLDAILWSRQSDPTREAGTIEVTLSAGIANARVTWRDDGCGMSDQVLSRAFTAFYTTKETGSGLGLSVTRTIIENHGGAISIESREGLGTTCHITLPNKPPEDRSAEREGHSQR